MPNPISNVQSGGASSVAVPSGVRFSSILLMLLAFALALCGVFFAAAFVISFMHHGKDSFGFYLGVGAVVALAASFLCIQAAKALRNQRRWGANIATACGSLAIVFGGVLLNDYFYGKQSPDEYFLYPVAPVFFLLGAWLCIYLNVPSVRASFGKRLD